jgi:multiple sugar transport system permease protein
MSRIPRPFWRSWWGFAPAGLIVALLTFFPIVLVLIASFSEWTVKSGPNLAGVASYERVLGDSYFLHSLRVTVLFSVISSVVSLTMGVAIGCALHSLGRMRYAGLALCSVPLLICPSTAAVVWRLALNEQTGVIPGFFGSLFGIQLPTLGSPTGALLAVCIVDIWQWTPLVILFVFTALARARAQVADLTMVDGLEPSTRFRRVLLPLIGPVIALALLVRISDSLRAFDVAQVLTAGGPGNATELLSLYAYRQLIKFGNYSVAAVAAVIMLVLATIAMLTVPSILRHRVLERRTL